MVEDLSAPFVTRSGWHPAPTSLGSWPLWGVSRVTVRRPCSGIAAARHPVEWRSSQRYCPSFARSRAARNRGCLRHRAGAGKSLGSICPLRAFVCPIDVVRRSGEVDFDLRCPGRRMARPLCGTAGSAPSRGYPEDARAPQHADVFFAHGVKGVGAGIRRSRGRDRRAGVGARAAGRPAGGDRLGRSRAECPACQRIARGPGTVVNRTIDRCTADHSAADDSTIDHCVADDSTIDHCVADDCTIDDCTIDHCTVDHAADRHPAGSRWSHPAAWHHGFRRWFGPYL